MIVPEVKHIYSKTLKYCFNVVLLFHSFLVLYLHVYIMMNIINSKNYNINDDNNDNKDNNHNIVKTL